MGVGASCDSGKKDASKIIKVKIITRHLCLVATISARALTELNLYQGRRRKSFS